MKHFWTGLLALGVVGCTAPQQTQKDNISGIYPKLAFYNNEGECGTGAVVPWAGSLWAITYGPHLPFGSSDKLYQITPDKKMTVRSESIGGTPANRLIHKESNQLNIGPYFINESGDVRVLPWQEAPGRYTGSARHLTDPANKIYIGTMEEGFYEVDVNTLKAKELYKDSKKVKIYMYDLPVIYKNKKYSVLNSEGEVVTTSKKAINYAGIYHDSFITVAYKDKTVLFDTSSNSQIDEEGLTIKLKGQYKIVANDYKKGFVLYDQQQINLAYVSLKGKVKFEKNIEVDSVKFKDSSLILKNEDGIRLLSLDGKKDVVATSYYKDVNNYLSKNASYIYGPHKFTKDGKEKDVKGIQLNPNVASVHGHIFPVYVQNKGYQYYGFNGKEAIKTIYKDAQDFDQYGVAVVSKDGEKYYLMNSKGEKQSKNYVKIESIGEGYYAAYETNSKYEIINTEGKIDIHDYFMGESQAFEFDGKVYALLNKSGTTYLYDMEKGESVFSLEGEYQLYNGKYLRKKNHKAYYDLEGNLIYKG